MRFAAVFLSAMLLCACGQNPAGKPEQAQQSATPDPNGADSMASNDNATAATQATDPQSVTMQAQVVLERLGFGSGIIDGKTGISTENALAGFQEAHDLSKTGKLDDATRRALTQWSNIPATRSVTIPAYWGQESYSKLPKDPAAQANLGRLGYQSIDERLAERFHTTVDVLKTLNPRTGAPNATPALDRPYFAAGEKVTVPNIGADWIDAGEVKDRAWLATLQSLGVGTRQSKAARLVVDKSSGWLKAYDKADKLIAMFTVTTGSSHDPLPLGNWKVKGVSRNPDFAYNPELFWDVSDSKKAQRLPPGPNGPVGVVWIDLNKPHYGIHGTPEPQTIGRAESHGCVRLTNWDAARLSLMVDGSTKVLFQA
ncbi:MAG: L,D-transpeptidase family protein [Candidatus Andeanibacterium colombiense]|uniref:L,D-transpeptidase family protein n=1 Tax=Candidatus Andeanibacterium colombiense TaxID=3121345 RepID=A0AAJ5X5W0_9SPHN|nr:MAG: L,D-transpeptidase family protein [Sphingomonadaceae bacterium]